MRVFLAGGTGAIGRYAVPALVSAGHDVTALVGAVPAHVDLFDVDRLAPAVAAAWAENDRIRRDGSANLVDAALAGGVPRIVEESIAFSYPDRGDNWIDEDTPLAPVELAGTVLDAEASDRRFADSARGNVAVVLRFGNFYGPGSGHTQSMLAAARRHAGPALGPADHWIGPLHLESAGDAVAAAIDAPGGIDNVAEEPVTWREFADALGSAVGEAPWLRLPGRVAETFGDRGGPLHRSQRVSSRRFMEATGWRPRYPSVRDGWTAVVGALDGLEPFEASGGAGRG